MHQYSSQPATKPGHVAARYVTTGARHFQAATLYTPLTADELAQYLARIGYVGAPDSSLATLQALQQLHSIAIAFDNLDSWLGKVPSLHEADVFHKLVRQQRGGYCFEHNQLFMRVLQSLGFAVQAIGARVLLPNLPTPRNHHAILVNLPQGLYLVDVGFGGIELTDPLQIDSNTPQQSLHDRWLIEPCDLPAHYVLSVEDEGQWVNKYSFNLTPQTQADYDMANWYVATHHESFLVNNLLAARTDTDGRHALLNTQYTRYYRNEAPLSISIDSPVMLQRLLQERFHINTAAVPGLEWRLEQLCRQ